MLPLRRKQNNRRKMWWIQYQDLVWQCSVPCHCKFRNCFTASDTPLASLPLWSPLTIRVALFDVSSICSVWGTYVSELSLVSFMVQYSLSKIVEYSRLTSAIDHVVKHNDNNDGFRYRLSDYSTRLIHLYQAFCFQRFIFSFQLLPPRRSQTSWTSEKKRHYQSPPMLTTTTTASILSVKTKFVHLPVGSWDRGSLWVIRCNFLV